MFYFKSIIGFIIVISAVLLFANYIRVPFVPGLIIYFMAIWMIDSEVKKTNVQLNFGIILIILSTLFALDVYGTIIFLSVKHYPDYQNWIGIFLDSITFITFLVSGLCSINLLYTFKKNNNLTL